MAAASGFSGAVRLVGLDDHISPSQACVKPVQAAGAKGVLRHACSLSLSRAHPHRLVADAAVSSRHRDADGSVVEIHSDGSRRKLPTAKISLQDCLACRRVRASLLRRSLCFCGSVLTASAVDASPLPRAFLSSK